MWFWGHSHDLGCEKSLALPPCLSHGGSLCRSAADLDDFQKRCHPQEVAGGCPRTAPTLLVMCDIGSRASAVQPVPTSGGDERPARGECLPSRSVLVTHGGDTVRGVLSEGQAVAPGLLPPLSGAAEGLLNSGQHQGKDSVVGPTPKFTKWVVGTESRLCLWHMSSAPQSSLARPYLGHIRV